MVAIADMLARLTPDRTQPAERSQEVPGGTRGNTARLLCTALRDTAAAVAEQSAQSAPSTELAMPLAVLWSRTHKFDAADPGWPDRDRFVLSAAASTPLLYALLHLTGHDGMEQATLDHCGELDAVAARVAAHGRHPAIEATAAPGGQTVAMAVGMALAERMLAGRFGKSLVDHRVWAVAEAAELGHGVVAEAAGLAGLMRLDRLALLVDGGAGGAEDAKARFASFGWAVKLVDADDADDIDSALSFAQRSRKPTLLWCAHAGHAGRSTGRGNPNALEAWRRVGARGSGARRAWLKRLTRHPQRAEFERVIAGRLPDGCHDALAACKQRLRDVPEAASPAATARQLLDSLAASVPELLCGAVEPVLASSRSVAFGGRPHGLAACLNGVALHAGTVPMSTVAMVDVLEQLPALRVAALLRRRVVHLAFDPGFDGGGAAWQPAELLGWLRAMPELYVFRPGCPVEAAECLELAMSRADGPSLLVLSRTPAPALRRDVAVNRCARGGYVLAEADTGRRATLIATGPGLEVAMQARTMLASDGIGVAVASLPCWSLFGLQDADYRRSVLGAAPRFGLEAGGRTGWDRWLGEGGVFMGCEDATAAGPAEAVRRHHGLTPDLVAQAVRRGIEGVGPKLALLSRSALSAATVAKANL